MGAGARANPADSVGEGELELGEVRNKIRT